MSYQFNILLFDIYIGLINKPSLNSNLCKLFKKISFIENGEELISFSINFGKLRL